MHKSTKLLVFTDLDGTLLDYHDYSFDPAAPALEELRKRGCPLVMASGRTRAEIENIQALKSRGRVIIVENGSAIYVDNDFPTPPGTRFELRNGYRAIVLGRQYQWVVDSLRKARTLCRTRLRGFSDMSAEEIARLTGLDIEAAGLAKEREFSEPIIFHGSPGELECLADRLAEMGLSLLEGERFFYVQGRTDKGRAAWMVADIYRKAYPDISWKTVALGDGVKDVRLLHTADIAVIIRKPDCTCMEYLPAPPQQVIVSSEPGPAGWNRAVLDLIREMEGC